MQVWTIIGELEDGSENFSTFGSRAAKRRSRAAEPSGGAERRGGG